MQQSYIYDNPSWLTINPASRKRSTFNRASRLTSHSAANAGVRCSCTAMRNSNVFVTPLIALNALQGAVWAFCVNADWPLTQTVSTPTVRYRINQT